MCIEWCTNKNSIKKLKYVLVISTNVGRYVVFIDLIDLAAGCSSIILIGHFFFVPSAS